MFYLKNIRVEKLIETPTAAYSLRKVKSDYDESAIRVRRSSDDTEQDIGFDANGDLDTAALTTFVNEEYDHIDEDFSSDLGWTFLNGTSNISGGTLNFNTSANDYAFYSYGAVPNQVVDIEFTISNYVSGSIFMLNFGGGYSSPTYTANQTVTLTNISIGNGNQNWGFRAESSGFVGSIDNFKVTVKTADGAVTTWYDQSGNGNDATNSTESEQPLVVDGGTLVEENGKAAIQFDGVNDNFNVGITLTGGFHTFYLHQSTKTGGFEYLFYSPADQVRLYDYLFRPFINSVNYPSGMPNDGFDARYLWEFARDDSANIRNYRNGSQDAFSSGVPTAGVDGADFTIDSIGAISNTLQGSVQEIIIYNSDQSGNRTSIEANIGRYYNIDGFADGRVTTWYDQSGNGNDATNSTESEQPLIVDGGILVEENGKPAIQFDGVNDELVNSSITLTQPFTYFHARRYRNTTTLRIALSLSTSTNGWADYLDGGQLRAFFGGSKSIAAGFNTNQNLWGAIVNGASSQVLLNGTSTAANLGTNNGDAVVIGDRGNISGVNAAVNSQEIIIFNSDQSTNRTGIEENINSRFNIYT